MPLSTGDVSNLIRIMQDHVYQRCTRRAGIFKGIQNNTEHNIDSFSVVDAVDCIFAQVVLCSLA